MPSPTTALQLIRDGLGLTNAVGTDLTLTADEEALGLRVFNDIVEDWSTQDMAVYGQTVQTFNTVANQFFYTIGAGGNWNTVRPVRINDPVYTTISGVTFLCTTMTQDEYSRIAYKGQTQGWADRYLYVNEFPLGAVTLWPVPNAVVPMTFSIDRILTAAATASTSISFPPGYARAFTYALGVALAPMFGKSISQYPDVVEIARTTFANIKRANKRPRIMVIDPAYGDTYYNRGWYL